MTPEAGEAQYLFFAGFRLDCRSGELQRNGRKVKLQAQPSRLLVVLASRAGELVTRAEIQKSLWDEETFVEFDQSINYCIKEIRDALGDHAEMPRFVQTVPRVGYRFIAPTEVSGLPEREPESSPYPGLLAFSSTDAPYFFGREEEVQTLWAKLERRHLLALIGPSGAGKTSLLHAGLIPGRPRGWSAVIFRPGENPFAALEQALRTELGHDPEKNPVSGSEPALAQLRQWRATRPEVLLCIDAFEELFTLNDESTRKAFSELVGQAAKSGIHALLSMRDDFFVSCHEHPELEPIFLDVTPLQAPRGAELRRALTEPARKSGHRFEDEALVAEILAEVTSERAALPLLAFAAARLWEKRDRARSVLTRKAYLEIGGVGGALAQHAEATLVAIGEERQAVVREIFRNLTTAKGTRASQDREELLSVFGNREEAAAVLGKLIDARLLTLAEREVEVVHESLLTAWPRLIQWRAQEAELAVVRDQLRQAASAWQERGRPEDRLWTGGAYRELSFWRERYQGGLTTTEQAFVEASIRLAERRRRRRRVAVGSLVAAALVVAAMTSSLWRQAKAEALRAEASKLLTLAELRLEEDPTEALASTIASLELADSVEARVFAMKVLWDSPPAFEIIGDSQAVGVPEFSPDGRWLASTGLVSEALLWSQDGGAPIRLPGHEPSNRSANVSQWVSDNLLVTGPSDGFGSRVHLWSVPEGRRIRTIDFGAPGKWQLGPGGLFVESVESGSAPRPDVALLRSWRLPEGDPTILGKVDFRKLGTWTSLFTPDGKSWLYAKGQNVYSRPLPMGAGPDRILARVESEVVGHWLAFDRLILLEDTGRTHVWSFPRDGVFQAKVFSRPDGVSRPPIPSPSGGWVAGRSSADDHLRLWSVRDWEDSRPLLLRRRSSWYASNMSYHPREDWVVASTARMTRLTFWPLRNSHATIVDGYKGVQRPLAFSPDGKWLATVWDEQTIRLWPIGEERAMRSRSVSIPDPPFRIRSLAFDPKNRYVFAVGRDRASVIPMDGSTPRALQWQWDRTALNAAAVSPAGRRVATAFFSGAGEKKLRVANIETGEWQDFDLPEGEPAPGSGERSGYEGGIMDMGFADETTLYSAGDGGLRRWDLTTGSQVLVAETSPGYGMREALGAEKGVAIGADWRLGQWQDCSRARIYDLKNGRSRELTEFGPCGTWNFNAIALDPSGTVAAIGTLDGSIRVGRLSGGEPHLLMGHRGAVDRVAISPDLRWVATSGEDDTLRLWPMPDLSKPALHVLPHEELLEKLLSLTNLRAVRDPSVASGWKIGVGPFPGWRDVPTW
jgi:WD40 repeat protein/DNA-binding winged helix-turn-helix (wHTH) protein